MDYTAPWSSWFATNDDTGALKVSSPTDISMEAGGTVSRIPEPATMLLFGTGLVTLARSRVRKKKNQPHPP